MGLSLSVLSWAWIEVIRNKVLPFEDVEVVLMKSLSLCEKEVKMTLRSLSFKRINSPKKTTPESSEEVVLQKSLSFKNWEHENIKLEPCPSFKDQVQNDTKLIPCPSFKDRVQNDSKLIPCPSFKDRVQNDTKLIPCPSFKDRVQNDSKLIPCPSFKEGLQPLCFKAAENQILHEIQSPRLLEFSSPRPLVELDAAAVKLQKCYKSYRTRRNLADCAVVVEELWWKALDFASLKRSSVSFFNIEKQETAVSRWARARTRAAKVGKGLSKDEKAQKLALQHWLEAIDPRHRYGHNLHLYYDVWFDSESTEPFFYWLDVGDGREVNLEKCTRSRLQQQCIKYLGPKEREAYEVIVEYGKLVYRQSGSPVNTIEGSKWIFVLSTTRTLYVGQKQKGTFQHSSFLAGAATTAAGRLVAKAGVLQAIWPYSGHYLPTEENFKEFISFLQDNDVDLSNVKRCSVDDDEYPLMKEQDNEQTMKVTKVVDDSAAVKIADEVVNEDENSKSNEEQKDKGTQAAFELGRRLSCKWTTGAGPRIGCVRDYPTDLQFKALEQVNLSPRLVPSPMGKTPIPSPRPSPNVRLSPRLSYMGIPTPKVSLTLPQHKWRTTTEKNDCSSSPNSAARMASVTAV